MEYLLKPTSQMLLTLPLGNVVEVGVVDLRFVTWSGQPLSDNYGGKAALDVAGEPLFAELAVLRALEQAGWDGCWVDSFKRKFRSSMPPSSCNLPRDAQKLFDSIVRARGKRGGCWDVFAWKGKRCLFVECKRKSKDAIQYSQLQWLEAALTIGLSLEDFIVCEWTME